MKKIILLALFGLSILTPTLSFASKKGGHHRAHHVRSYTRKNGTRVHSYNTHNHYN